MRKIIFLFLLIVMVAVPLAAVDFEASKTFVNLSVTVQNVVYVGVSKSAVTSSILPTDRINEIGFTYDQYTAKWVTTSAYIYAISFVGQYLTINIKPSKLQYTSDDTTSTLDYTLNIISNTSGNGCNDVKEKKSSSITDGTSYNLVTESSDVGTDLTKPRVMCWEFQMEIDASAVTVSAADYVAEFTMTISSSN